MKSFLQFLIIGLGAGAAYALFAQGAVLIYRGSGLVNFAQGAIGTFAAYIAFVDLKDKQGWSTLPALVVAVIAAGIAALVFQTLVLRALRNAAAIVRVIATIGLLGLLQASRQAAWLIGSDAVAFACRRPRQRSLIARNSGASALVRMRGRGRVTWMVSMMRPGLVPITWTSSER